MSMTDSNIETIHQNIHQRQSIGQLIEPAPNTQQLEKAVQAALTAPDHHRLKPTRFVIITPEQTSSISCATLGFSTDDNSGSSESPAF